MGEWQDISAGLKKTLELELSPVAVAVTAQCPPDEEGKKYRICRALLEAAGGRSFSITSRNNACFGASWHLGFRAMDDPRVAAMVRKFVVEGEKLFATYEALEKLIEQMGPPPDNARSCFRLAPCETAGFAPQLVVFVVNPHEACRLLTLAAFEDGVMPAVRIGGPTCRMMITYPLASGQVNVSFYDYTARRMCTVPRDKLLVSVPYAKLKPMAAALDRCSAGTAKVEFPPEFREFLQKRMTRRP